MLVSLLPILWQEGLGEKWEIMGRGGREEG